jgi:hypothetical protein
MLKHPLWSALYDAGYGVTAAAEEIGVSVTWLSLVLNGHVVAPASTREALATLLGRDPETIWPEYTPEASEKVSA